MKLFDLWIKWVAPMVCSALMAAVACAQGYPSKTVTLVSPFAAGGTSDVIARATARLLEAELGPSVVVVNRLGAGGTIGIASIFNGPADGYQLVMGGLGSVVFTSAVYKGRLSYDPVKDLLPVGVVGSAPSVITVRASLNVKTLAELIALAKANPDKLSFGSAGVGGALHVAGVLLEKEAGISLNHIPYKGGAPAINDLAAGVVDIALADLTLIKPVLQGDRVRPLAIATGERSPMLPQVPTTAELGLPNVRMDTWYAVFAPAGTPAPVLARLRSAMDKVRVNPELVNVLVGQGITPINQPLKAFEDQLRRDFEIWPGLLQRICSQSSCL